MNEIERHQLMCKMVTKYDLPRIGDKVTIVYDQHVVHDFPEDAQYIRCTATVCDFEITDSDLEYACTDGKELQPLIHCRVSMPDQDDVFVNFFAPMIKKI